MPRITPFLWVEENAEAVAAFYTSVFPDAGIDLSTSMPSESPSGPPGSVKVVSITLCGQPFTVMSAKGAEPFNHAVSMVVECADQAEVDRYWDALMAGGGHPEACGWLRDRYGLAWQIVPVELFEMMAAPDREAAKRASDAMMGMIKLDLPALRAAFAG